MFKILSNEGSIYRIQSNIAQTGERNACAWELINNLFLEMNIQNAYQRMHTEVVS